MRLNYRAISLIGLLQAGATITLVFSLATFANHLHRYLELFSHFRVQYLIASALIGLIFIAMRNRTWSVLMLAVVAVNALPVATWYFAPSNLSSDFDAQIELLFANVYSGNSNTRDLMRLIESEQPDVIFLQEVTDSWVTVMNEMQGLYPHRHTIARNDNFGVAVYARDPLLHVDVHDSPPFGFPSLVVQQLVQGRTVTFVTTHPIPPLGESGFDARNEQLASVAQLVAAIDGPKILIGDLNTTMWAHHYNQLADDTGLVNARHGFGVIPSWPTQLPFAMIPIDHCLVSGEFAVQDIRTGPDIGSDHLPLLVTLVLL